VGYAQQLIVCTGQRNWTSRIEDDGKDQGWGNLVRGLKSLMGRGGKYLDVSRHLAKPTNLHSAAAKLLLMTIFCF
jgi:hypothetical protein